jgi:hypothetical protein
MCAQAGGPGESGSRADLIQRVADWLGPQFAEPEQRRQAALKLRQQQAELHRDVPFYDVDDYHNSKLGESRFIVEQLLSQLGPVADWLQDQVDEGAGDDNVLVHQDPTGNQLVVVPVSKHEFLIRLLHEELARGVWYKSLLCKASVVEANKSELYR